MYQKAKYQESPEIQLAYQKCRHKKNPDSGIEYHRKKVPTKY